MKNRSDQSRTSPARILLLQGPVGPFFKELSQALNKDGAEITHLTFNKGDASQSDDRFAIPVTASVNDFEDTLRSILSSHFDVIVMFGSERPAHIIARRVALEHNIPVVSFEEGYIRPGSVTLELGGNNANSPITKCDVSALKIDDQIPLEGHNFRGFWPMVWHGANYYMLRQIFSYERERSFFHRETPLASEIFYWLRNVTRKLCEGYQHTRAANTLIKEYDGEFYIVPLQVPSDANMREASNGWTGTKLVHEVIKSFAHSAPQSARLVFKIHPMSRGHSSEHKLIQNLARSYRIDTRTCVIHSGSLGFLTRASAGMITINSTSGLSAIHHNVPLLVLGKSIYTHDSVAHVGNNSLDIDDFWNSKLTKDKVIRRSFLTFVKKSALITGDFYAKRGRALAVKNARLRILALASQQRDTLK